MKELKFIHITKCAGTSIENIGKKHNINWGRFHKKEYGSYHRVFVNKPKSLREKYDWFLVVRNPYERVISEFYCRWGGIRIHGKSPYKASVKEFNNYIKKSILSCKKNINRVPIGHFCPQYLYIDSNVTQHVLQFENLHDEFNALMKRYNLNMKLDQHNNKCPDNKDKKKFTIDSLSPETIELINEFYDKDFETFNYKKI